jgi:elongation factor G
MDYLPQERARGITIRAAAITFGWQGFHINLIDTPGHVDFSGEVERSLRVMDGSVLVVDSNNGVQTQTKSVWKQADKFSVPRIIFLNKMDLHSASTELTIGQLKTFFNANPLLMQMPVFQGGYFTGFVDLVRMVGVKYMDVMGTSTKEFDIKDLSQSDQSKVSNLRTELLENISNADDDFAEKYLSGTVTNEDLMMTVRKLTVNLKAFPVFCGSALKNRGVQPVLDAVANFLPSPAEAKAATGKVYGNSVSRGVNDAKFCGLAYKYISNTKRGHLVYVRIYSGRLKHGDVLRNTKRSTHPEKINKLLRVRSNEYVELSEAKAGDVVAIGGPQDIFSGDTLIHKDDREILVLDGMKMPPPVFFCSIYSESESQEKDLENVLKAITKEDPSYSARYDDESAQTLVTGQGELHLEILRDRIESDFGIKTRLGEIQVAYREALQQNTTYEYEIDKPNLYFSIKIRYQKQEENQDIMSKPEEAIHGDNFNKLLVSVHWTPSGSSMLKSKLEEMKQKKIKYDEEDFIPISKLSKEQEDKLKTAIIENLKNSVLRGPVGGYPLINGKIEVIDGIMSKNRTEPSVINECVSFAAREMFKVAEGLIYEPIMDVSFEIPDEFIGELVADVSSNRRGTILEISKAALNSVVLARIPLKEMMGYTSILRGISKGCGSMEMKFYCFEHIQSGFEGSNTEFN